MRRRLFFTSLFAIPAVAGPLGFPVLSETFMMEPEASVSALAFHHPEARYFSVVEDGAVPAGS